ncbi:flavin reductase family protein [Aspergillus lucknowensis]|uniref:Flavin reductase like domain-containing protein n=1 Tax=Aspergillus lucknowensis TaxID=176173 RepID=A0ABR4LQY6_9EURO
MFYKPGVTDHGLPHDPFKACVIPRPIGWISTKSPSGVNNLAPYSQFNNLTFDPPYVMFSANQTVNNTRKDTVRNVEATGHFVWNLATYALRDAVNKSAQQLPYGVDEFAHANLTPEQASLVKCDMVRESPVKFECEYHSTLRLPGNPPMGTVDVVIGRVVGVHIDDRVLNEEGLLDVHRTEPIARCGYYQYTVVREVFDMVIPGMDEDVLYGLEGSVKRNRERFEKGKEAEGGGE